MVFPRSCGGILCSTTVLLEVPCLELPSPDTTALGSRGAVGRRGIPGLSSFGDRNLELRTF